MNAHTLRNRAVRAARDYFKQRNILEVRTAKAVMAAAMEPYIDAFSLAGSQQKPELRLATSPEIAMKKIFAAEMAENSGAAGIYEIAAVFRDDPATKNHASEFTMVEWYERDCLLAQILQNTADLVCTIAGMLEQKPPENRLEIYSLQSLFAECGLQLDFADPTCFAKAWSARHGNLPHSLNDLDLAIAAFNLLFDEIILPRLKQESGLCAVYGYPEILGAMAYCENGVAERAEIYLEGVELANGYREEFRPQVVRERWLRYNEIRILRGEAPHTIDEGVLSSLPTLEGVAGIALGLERTLAALATTLTLQNFG